MNAPVRKHTADATTVEEGLAIQEEQAKFDSEAATAVAMQNTLLTPRFYTTDFDELDAIEARHEARLGLADDPGQLGVGQVLLQGSHHSQRVAAVADGGQPEDAQFVDGSHEGRAPGALRPMARPAVWRAGRMSTGAAIPTSVHQPWLTGKPEGLRAS